MKKCFSNEDIMTYTSLMVANFLTEEHDIILPIKVNYSLQINYLTFYNRAKKIEELRMEIGRKYGKKNEETDSYEVPFENIPAAEKAINDLMEIEQNLDVMTIKLEDLSECNLTTQQMRTLIFMIEEE